MYEIFIGELGLTLVHGQLLQSLSGRVYSQVLAWPTLIEVDQLVLGMMEGSATGDIALAGDADELYNRVAGRFELQEAAGGVVKNDRGEMLLIFRRGFWDLPKGKLDNGESNEACALREVTEETGAQNIRLSSRDYILSYHAFTSNQKWILKRTTWFRMSAPHQALVPQAEEDIEEAIWVPRSDLHEYLPQMYRSIRPLVEQG